VFKQLSRSLEYRLAVAVSLGLLAFAIIAGAIGFYVDYRAQIRASGDLQRQLVRTLQAQAEVAAYAGNAQIAADVLNGLMTHETVARVRLTSTDGFVQQAARGQPTGSTSNESHYVLRSPVDQVSPIGELTVAADETVVRQAAVRSAVNKALERLVQILLTLFILALVFRRVVGQPISELAHRLAAIQPGSPERLYIDAKHRHDEIGVLSEGANSLLDAADGALQHERELREKVEAMEQHYRHIFETTHVGIMVLQPDGRLINSNPILLQKVVGIHFDGQYTPQSEDFISSIFVHPERAWSMVREASDTGRTMAADLQLKTGDSRVSWAHCILSVSHDQLGQMDIIEGVLYDVTARRAKEDQARQLAQLDALTGISNRYGTEVFMGKALRHAHADRAALSVFSIDLDGFKAVNDTYGHAAGDCVLVEVANRLHGCIRRSTDWVGRMGGDEFVLIVCNFEGGVAQLEKQAKHIVATVSCPIVLPTGNTVTVGVSIGISRLPLDGVTSEQLFASADAAMYEVKRRGKYGYTFATKEGADSDATGPQ